MRRPRGSPIRPCRAASDERRHERAARRTRRRSLLIAWLLAAIPLPAMGQPTRPLPDQGGPGIPLTTSADAATAGSAAPNIVLEDITNTLRAAFFRSVAISPVDPQVAYVASYEGYVWRTRDGGRTWDESRLIPEVRAFYGDQGERKYFGVHRQAGPGSHGVVSPSIAITSSDSGGSASGAGTLGGGGAAANVNFGIGLPGQAPRLQLLVRKLGKPTSGVNIKQTLLFRGSMPTEVRLITIHPRQPNILFAATAFGLYRSLDAGDSWVRIYTGTKPTDRFAFHLAVDPRDDNHLLLATGDGLWVSTDGGDSFAKATAGGVGSGVILWVYFNPHDSRYAFVGGGSGLLRSSDGGKNWDYIYFTTFPAARWVTTIQIDPFDQKTGYISTPDGIFTTPDLLTGGLESWKRLGGLQFTGVHVDKITACSRHRGHLWAITNMRIPTVNTSLSDTGGAFIYETLDGGQTWKVINSGNTRGSMQWFENDPTDPDLLWIVWSRSLARMQRRPAGQATAARVVIPDDPPIGQVLLAALRFTGLEQGRMLDYRRRSRWKAIVPQLNLTYHRYRLDRFSILQDWLFPTLPFRLDDRRSMPFAEFRCLFTWDLSEMVFNLDASLFGRIERLSYEAREYLILGIHRLYGELRRLRILLANDPPTDRRTRLMYRLRVEELTSYIDFITGNYLTRWRQGDHPAGLDTKWWEPWAVAPRAHHQRR